MPITVKGESHIYVHEMDYGRRQRLHEILDTNDTWRELNQMFMPPYPREKIEKFARYVYQPGGSPTDALLTDWGRGNRTVVELFKFLAHMKHYQAMECLREDIPVRYHKYIPRGADSRGRPPESINRSAVSTVNLPIPANNTSKPKRNEAAVESSSAAGPPSYRSRSNVQMPNRDNYQMCSGRNVVPPKSYNQIRDKIVLNNLDSNQRQKEPSEAEKYPKKNLQNNNHNYEGASNIHIVDLPSDQLSEGGLAKQLNQQHNAIQQHIDSTSNLPQILVDQAQLGANKHYVKHQLGLNKSRHKSQPSTFMRSESQGTNLTIADSTFKKRILEEGKVSSPNPDIMLKNVDVRELSEACNDFHISNQIGKGGFGVVYRGRWNGQDIAVKRIKDERRIPGDVKVFKRYVNQAINELISLHNFPAENILQLLAYSYNETYNESCGINESLNTDLIAVDLVYMYMVNGSVSDRLRRIGGTEPLSWDQRSNIALGTARGLLHLHSNNIIHGDIKSGNILLDKHFEPKIGDFGLARGGPESDSLSYILASSLQGTMSYLPDDYCRSHQLTTQVDTFCYGMLLFELVSGKSPSWQNPDCGRRDLPDYCKCKKRSTMRELMLAASSLKHHAKLVDQMAGLANTKSDSNHQATNATTHPWAECLFRFGKDCTKTKRKARPMMGQIFNALEKVHQNPSCLSWMSNLELNEDTELILSSVILSSEGNPSLPTLKDGNIDENKVPRNPSAEPLPPTDSPTVPASKSEEKPCHSNIPNQGPVPYIPAMIPLPVLLSNSISMGDDESSSNKDIDVVSEDQTEAAATTDRYRIHDEDDDSDEGNEESRSYVDTKDESGNDISDSKFSCFVDIPNVTPLDQFTNRGLQYEMPNLEDLSVKSVGRKQNEELSDVHGAASRNQPAVPQPAGVGQDEFDDGIPKLPDLGWVSDQGEVDPMIRLYNAESAVSEASKQDLMSDLPHRDFM